MTSARDEAFLDGWRACIEYVRAQLNQRDWIEVWDVLTEAEAAALLAPDAGQIEVASWVDEGARPGSCPASPSGLHHFVMIGRAMRCDECGRRLHNDDEAA